MNQLFHEQVSFISIHRYLNAKLMWNVISDCNKPMFLPSGRKLLSDYKNYSDRYSKNYIHCNDMLL